MIHYVLFITAIPVVIFVEQGISLFMKEPIRAGNSLSMFTAGLANVNKKRGKGLPKRHVTYDKTIVTVLLSVALFGCTAKQSNFPIPYFKGNSSLKGDFLKRITNDKDFSVVYTVSGTWQHQPTIKVFCMKDDVWEKIEIVNGLAEVDTAYSETDVDFISKEIILKKECRKEEAKKFFDQLIEFGLFELEEGRELEEKCREARADHTFPDIADATSIHLYIIKNNRVRILIYDESLQRCPTLSQEWTNIRKIRNLFEKEWYVKKHY